MKINSIYSFFRLMAWNILFGLSCMELHAQVGINTTTPDASSMLDISSTNKGILVPRMNTAQRLGIPSPATGLLVYETNSSRFFYFNGTSWVALDAGNQDWSLAGNAGTNQFTNFIGTSDNMGLSVRTNNTERLHLTEAGGAYFTGSSVAPGTFINGQGTRMMWLPHKAAFRAGQVNNSQWDDFNIGPGSFAGGSNNQASGANASAMGNDNVAGGISSFAMGSFNSVTGLNSISMGNLNQVVGPGALALGTSNNVSGFQNIAIGKSNNLQNAGNDCYAFGKDNSIQTSGTMALGFGIQINSGFQGFGMGRDIQINNGSILIGNGAGPGFNSLNDFQMPAGSFGIGLSSTKPTLVVTPLPGFSATGKVGINTLNPTSKLEITGDGTTISTSSLHVKDNIGSTALYVNDLRQVGINTNTPIATLDVRGNGISNATTALTVRNSQGITGFMVRDDGHTGIGISNPSTNLHIGDINNSFSALRITNNTNNSQGLRVSTSFNFAEVVNEQNGSLALGTNNNPTLTFSTNNNLVFTGNQLGVGTPTPSAKLHVNGAFRLEDGTQATGRVLTCDALGNATWQNVQPGNTWSLNGNASTNPASSFIGTTDNNAMTLRTNNVERIRVSATGQVGINTTVPHSTLHTNGSVAMAVRTVSGSTTLTASDYCLVFTGTLASQLITLPPAGLCSGRVYSIVNHSTQSLGISAVAIGSSTNLAGLVAGSAIQIISDGSVWRKIN